MAYGMTGEQASRTAAQDVQATIEGLTLPQRIGVCINYGVHVWYRAQSAVERNLATQLGIAILAPWMRRARTLSMLERAHAAGIPVIAESIWVDSPAVATNAMINEVLSGQKIGRVAADWICSRLGRRAKVLDVTVPWIAEAVQRWIPCRCARKFAGDSVRVDGRADIHTSTEVAAEILGRDPTFNVVLGVDDESAIDARKAYEALRLPLDDILICSLSFA